MRYKRHRNGMPRCWYVYGDGDDPITEVTGVGGYTGEIFPCNGEFYHRPVCAGPNGEPCGKLHAHTGTTQHPKHPEADTWGHETREAATDAMMSVRRQWAQEIERERGDG